MTVDQPLFAIAKKIPWAWPDVYGDSKYGVMMGGLHIEIDLLNVLGHWLWLAESTNDCKRHHNVVINSMNKCCLLWRFATHVQSMIDVVNELGKRFTETSDNLCNGHKGQRTQR